MTNIMNLLISVCGLWSNFPGYMTYGGLSLNSRRRRASLPHFLRRRGTFSFPIAIPLSLSSLASLLLSFSFLYFSLPSLLTGADERGSPSRGYGVHPFCKHQSWVHHEAKEWCVSWAAAPWMPCFAFLSSAT